MENEDGLKRRLIKGAPAFIQYSHYSLLATVEAIFNLGRLRRNDTSATAMPDLFRGGIP
jgi:hypothetical protein